MTWPFENDTNAAVKRLAAQRIRANKGKNTFIVMAIVLTTVLFAALFAVAGGFLDQWKQIQQLQHGKAHATIKFLTQEQRDSLLACNSLAEVYFTQIVGMAQNEELLKLKTEVRYAQDGSARSFLCYPSTGSMPRTEEEIATSTLVLEALGVPCELGASVHLVIDVDGVTCEKDLRLCGFWEGYERAQAQMAWVGEALADSVAPAAHRNVWESGQYGGIFCADIYFASEWNVNGQMNALLEEVGEESGIYELPISANPSCGLGITAEDIDAASVLAVILLLAMIIFVGYLIIYNMFSISVAQDVQFFGLLRTVGAGGRQIKGIVRRQAFMLALRGLPLGLAAGYLVGRLFLPYVVMQTTMDATGIYRIDPLVLIGAAMFSLLTVYISSLKPCGYAAGISAMEAVRYVDVDSGVRRRTKKSRRTSPYTMAAANLRRSRRKAALVVWSLSLGMILLNITYTAVSGFDMETYIDENTAADFCVSDYTVFNVVFPKNLSAVSDEFMQGVSRLEGLEDSAYIYAAEVFHPVPDAVMERFLREKSLRQAELRSMESMEQTLEEYRSTHAIIYGIDYAALNYVTMMRGAVDETMWESGDCAIVCDFYYERNGNMDGESPLYRIGDEISLTDQDGDSHAYTVSAVGRLDLDVGAHYYSDLGLCVILPMQGYEEVFGQTQPLTAVFNVSDGYRAAAEDWVADYTTHVEKNLNYVSYRVLEQEFYRDKAAYTVIGSVLGGILALIGLLNFVNVTVTSLLARQKELAVLSAAGMGRGQMKKMLACEGMAYIALAFLVTVTLGSGAVYLICEQMVSNVWAFRYHFTILPVAVSLPFMLAVAAVVPLGFYRRMSRRSIVERLRVAE